MSKIFSLLKKKQDTLFSVAVVALFVLICIPLFVVAKYNYMSADDYGYGAITYQAIQNGQPWKIFGLAAKQAVDTYQTWQGSFSAVFLFALQPGIWGEKYYRLGICIIIFCLILMQFLLIRRIAGTGQTNVSRKYLVGICALLCLVQIFYVPYPEECFYWFNGGLYYTFFYTLQLLLLSETLVLFRFPAKLTGKQWMFFGWMLILAVIIGGGNLATGLSSALALSLLTVMLFVQKKDHRFYILALTAVYLFSFVVSAMAPGNMVRAQDPGYHTMSPVSAVLLTMWHCIINLYSWTDYQMWLVLFIAAPLLWRIAGAVIKNWKFTFRLPVIATVFLFGIYASQLTPITYMDGTFGPKRMGDMMWYSYVLLLFCVEGYWLGWLRYRFADQKVLGRIKSLFSNYSGIIQLCCLALWCVLVLMTDVRSSSTYKAWAAVRSGEAEIYAAENEERLEILHNPEIKDVYFHAIVHKVEPIYSSDIVSNNQGYQNTSMASFYNKNTVNLIEE